MYQWNTSRVSKGHLVQEGKIIFASEGLLYFMIILIAFSNGARLFGIPHHISARRLEIDTFN